MTQFEARTRRGICVAPDLDVASDLDADSPDTKALSTSSLDQSGQAFLDLLNSSPAKQVVASQSVTGKKAGSDGDAPSSAVEQTVAALLSHMGIASVHDLDSVHECVMSVLVEMGYEQVNVVSVRAGVLTLSASNTQVALLKYDMPALLERVNSQLAFQGVQQLRRIGFHTRVSTN